MASDCKSPRKEKGKWRKKRKWEDQTSGKVVRKAEKQVDRHIDWQRRRKTSTQKGSQRSFVGLSILSD